MGERSREKAGNGEKPLPGGDAGTASFLNRFRKGDVLVGIVENDGDIVLRNQVDGADFPVRLACVPESAGQFFHLVLQAVMAEGGLAVVGEAHAEVNAIRSVKDESLLKRSTIYVSLEPCSHYGKTPPCADLIIEKQIPRIVIGCQDPFSQVAGRGIQKLKDAGREVIVGVLESECRQLIRRFITFNTLHRPYITLKWAESADHFIDLERTDGQPVVLSSPLTSMLVHKRRAESVAIMVGRRTALLDNPSLTVRNWYGRNPIRVVLDRTLSLPNDLQLFDGNVPTLVFTANKHPEAKNITYITIDFNHL